MSSYVNPTRRVFMGTAAVAGLSVATQGLMGESSEQVSTDQDHRAGANHGAEGDEIMNEENTEAGEIVKAKVRGALLAGPDRITRDATVAEMDALGKMTVLCPETKILSGKPICVLIRSDCNGG